MRFQFRSAAPTCAPCPRPQTHDHRNRANARSARSPPSSGSSRSARAAALTSISTDGCPACMPSRRSRRTLTRTPTRPTASPRAGAGEKGGRTGTARQASRPRVAGSVRPLDEWGRAPRRRLCYGWRGDSTLFCRASLSGRSGLSIARRAGSGRAHAERQAARKRRLFLCPISGMECPNAPTFLRS